MAPLQLVAYLYLQGNIPIYQLNYFQKLHCLPQLHQGLLENIKVLLLLIRSLEEEFYQVRLQN